MLVALAFAAWRRWGTANELPKDGRFVLAYASLAFIVITGFVIEALRLAVQQPACGRQKSGALFLQGQPL